MKQRYLLCLGAAGSKRKYSSSNVCLASCRASAAVNFKRLYHSASLTASWGVEPHGKCSISNGRLLNIRISTQETIDRHNALRRQIHLIHHWINLVRMSQSQSSTSHRARLKAVVACLRLLWSFEVMGNSSHWTAATTSEPLHSSGSSETQPQPTFLSHSRAVVAVPLGGSSLRV